MNNTLSYGIFVALLLACFVGLTVKVGFIMACVITFILTLLIPREFYALLLGLIMISINMTLMEWLFRYWPVTLILGLWALVAHQSNKDSVTKSKEESPCKRFS